MSVCRRVWKCRCPCVIARLQLPTHHKKAEYCKKKKKSFLPEGEWLVNQ